MKISHICRWKCNKLSSTIIKTEKERFLRNLVLVSWLIPGLTFQSLEVRGQSMIQTVAWLIYKKKEDSQMPCVVFESLVFLCPKRKRNTCMYIKIQTPKLKIQIDLGPWFCCWRIRHARTCSFSSSALILERAVKSIIWHINTNSITTITVNALATWQFQRCWMSALLVRVNFSGLQFGSWIQLDLELRCPL